MRLNISGGNEAEKNVEEVGGLALGGLLSHFHFNVVGLSLVDWLDVIYCDYCNYYNYCCCFNFIM